MRTFKNIKTTVFITFLICLNFYSIYAQPLKDSKIEVVGAVYHSNNRSLLKDVYLLLESDGQQVSIMKLSGKEKFKLFLDYGKKYTLLISKVGYISSSIEINTKNVPKLVRIAGQNIDLDLTLSQTIIHPKLDYEVGAFGLPIAKAKYSSKTKNITFDYKYTSSVHDARINVADELSEKFCQEQ